MIMEHLQRALSLHRQFRSSIMAEAILNREGRGNFCAFSAGNQPQGLPLYARSASQAELRRERLSLKLEQFSGPVPKPLDFVFTVCDNCRRNVPVLARQPMTAHWGVPVRPPPLATKPIAARLRGRVPHAQQSHLDFRQSLALLDRLSLQRQLDNIGKTKDSAA
jgi:arsenate reductase